MAIQALGFTFYDAYHVAFAESAECDTLLTTDDKLIRRAQRISLGFSVQGPIERLAEHGYEF